MKKLLFLLLLFSFTAFNASAQYFQWAKSQEGVRWNQYDLAAGANFLAETGLFHDTISLGGQTFTRQDSLNAYLSVSDFSGNVTWAKHIVNNSFDPVQVTVDLNQNILISGYYYDSLYIGSLLFKGTTPGTKGIFVAKFDSGGNLLWSRSSTLTSAFQPFTTSLTTDGSGNVFVAGAFN